MKGTRSDLALPLRVRLMDKVVAAASVDYEKDQFDAVQMHS
jgi:hypothetical protein